MHILHAPKYPNPVNLRLDIGYLPTHTFLLLVLHPCKPIRMDTTGYVYFAIKSDLILELKDFKQHLSLSPTRFSKKFEKGEVPKATIWEYSSGQLTNPCYFEVMEDMMDVLVPHTEEFIRLKEAIPDLCFVLQVVVYLGDETPGLHFSNKVQQFTRALDAGIDCDIFNDK